MPSKLKKALCAVKDHTSIGLARVSKTASGSSPSSRLDVLVLKATTHEEVPVDERHVNDILHLTSTSRPYAACCVHALSRRIDRTRSWVVALKCLQLVHRALRDGGPFFPREALSAMRRGARLLNLSSFRDDSSTSSSPWDFTAFVRTYALFLDERLDLALLSKLPHRRANHASSNASAGQNRFRDSSPSTIVDRVGYWLALLDRAVATRPTGPARNNRLVHVSLHAVVRESFDLYRDASDGVAMLLDRFFELDYRTGVAAYHVCSKAARQFEELRAFYDACKAIGVGRKAAEYPAVETISTDFLDALYEFMKGEEDSFFSRARRIVIPLKKLIAPPEPEDDDETPVKDETPPRVALTCVPFDEMPAAGKSEESAQFATDVVDSSKTLAAAAGIGGEMVAVFEEEKAEWELVLAKSASDLSLQGLLEEAPGLSSERSSHDRNNSNNPFLDGLVVWAQPAALPTFRAGSPDGEAEQQHLREAEDLFSSPPNKRESETMDASARERLVREEQQRWLERQRKIIRSMDLEKC